MYSLYIEDILTLPMLYAYDNYGAVDVDVYENNLNINIVGTYTIIYYATNTVGVTYYTITVNVVDIDFPDLPVDILEYYLSTAGKTGNN